MGKHLAEKPTVCLQCFRPGLVLQGGRCGACRGFTPTEVWRQHHQVIDGSAVRVDAFGASLRNTLELRSILVPVARMEEMREKMERDIEAMHIHRVETIGPRIVKEHHSDVATGDKITRITIIERGVEIVDD